ncbi:MAG: hypothetical protein GX051_00650 [Clostridiales bacterium]|nr:hypothetical protein [Clostridiales bacterium]
MWFLYILLGITAFFVIVLSIKVTVTADYSGDSKAKIVGKNEGEFEAHLKWLFLDIPLYPAQKKKKKPKKEKPPKEEKPPEENAAPKEKKPNFIVEFIKNQGYDGTIKLITDIGNAMKGFMASMLKSLVINELYLELLVTGSDAADTAIEYGETCAKIWPVLGKLCSTYKVRKYDFCIEPDYLSTKGKAAFFVSVSARPIHITNAAVVLAVRLLFKVVLKLLFSKSKKGSENKNTQPDTKIKQGGVTQ